MMECEACEKWLEEKKIVLKVTAELNLRWEMLSICI